MMLKWQKISGMMGIFIGVITNHVEAQEPLKIGKVKAAVLNEISGIIPSTHNHNCFWVHNDSGDQAKIYLIDSMAGLQSTVLLEGITLIDAEDIATLKIQDDSYLLLADIGNNLRNRDTLSLFLFKEPLIQSRSRIHHIPREQIIEIRFRYKDRKRDAEALFVDPVDNTIYVVSKRDFKSTVFKLSITELNSGIVHELEPLLELPFTFVTAADISTDGRYIVIKNLTSIFLWERNIGRDIISVLQEPYKNVAYQVEPQGEAICFDRDNRSFYTISERPFGLDAYLYKYNY